MNSVNEFGWNAEVGVCSKVTGCDPVALDGRQYAAVCMDQPFCARRDDQGNLQWKRCHNDWMPNPKDMGGGYFSYDNILSSAFLLLCHITMEGWTGTMYTVGTNDIGMVWTSRIFHCVWVLLGAFFVIQLALAVIANKYFIAQEEERTLRARIAMDEEAVLQTGDMQTLAEIQINLVRRKSKFLTRRRSSILPQFLDRFNFVAIQGFLERLRNGLYMCIPGLKSLVKFMKNEFAVLRHRCNILVMNSAFSKFILLAIVLNTICMAIEHHDQPLYEKSICQRRCDLDPDLPANASCIGPVFNRTFDVDAAGLKVRHAQLRSFCFLDSNPVVSKSVVCNKLGTVEECYASTANCFWVNQQVALFSQSNPNYKPCKMGLYNGEEFGQESGAVLSLRHLCHDDNLGCPAFNPVVLGATTAINTVLTVVFILEMVLKMLGMGPETYFEDSWNFFDFCIVLASIVEFLMVMIDPENDAGGGSFSILRSLRLFRLFKLFRQWAAMRKILGTLGTALRALQLVFCLFLLIAYIFALLMMSLFAGTFKFVKTENPRSNFDSFLPSTTGHGAFMTVFQIITTENWTTIMYNCITGSDQPLMGLLALGIVAVGNYVIMNLFVAILLSKMEEEGGEDDEKEEDGKLPGLSNESSGVLALFKRLRSAARPATAPTVGDTNHKERLHVNASMSQMQKTNDTPRSAAIAPIFDRSAMAKLDLNHDDKDVHTVKVDIMDTFLKVLVSKKSKHHRDAKHYHAKIIRVPNHRALGILPPKHPFRLLMAYIAHHPLFDQLILLCILISSIMLAIESNFPTLSVIANYCPVNGLDCSGRFPGQLSHPNVAEDYVCPRYQEQENYDKIFGACGSKDEPDCCEAVRQNAILTTMDTVFTIVFVVEMFIKLCTEGAVFHKNAYFSNSWNILDAFIVVISVLSLILGSTGGGGDATTYKALKALRAFRVLRPLRVVKRQPQLKTTVLCIIRSFPSMITVGVVLLLYLFVLAMFTVQLFKGRFFRCYDPQDVIYYGATVYPTGNLYTAAMPLSGPTSIPTLVECASRTNGLGVWQDSPFTFNDLFAAILTLFEMATTEGWLMVMAGFVDGVGTGITPVQNYNPFWAFFCFLHIMMGSFVLLNLLVSMVINNYIKIKSENDGISPMITAEQKEWVETQKLILQRKPRVRQTGPAQPFRAMCYKTAVSGAFEAFITICILANFCCMLSKTHSDSCQINAQMVWINFGFASVFFLEAVVKLIGLGPKWYFHDDWNKIDLSIVFLSSITIGMDFGMKMHVCSGNLDEVITSVPGLGVLRSFRIARVFRLVRRARSLELMIRTLITSLPALANIASLISLFLLIFAVLGTTLFWNVSHEQDLYGGVDGDGNYASFDNAFFLLFRQTTGETWNSVMYYCSQTDLNLACADTRDEYKDMIGCGGPEVGRLFHVLWQFVGTYLMMQLITAVILENFDDMAKDDIAIISKESLDDFVDKWNEFDPDATSYILSTDVPKLLGELEPPLGVKARYFSSIKLLAVIKDLAIPVRGDKVRYKDTFLALVRRAQAHYPEEHEQEVDIFASDASENESDKLSSDDDDNPYAEHEAKIPEIASRTTPRCTKSSEQAAARAAERVAQSEGENELLFRDRRPTIAEDYAVRILQTTYKEWRETRLQVHKARSVEMCIRLAANRPEIPGEHVVIPVQLSPRSLGSNGSARAL